MRFKKNTYLTFFGIIERLELENRKESEWVIYSHDNPTFYVDLLNSSESNKNPNSPIFSTKRIVKDLIQTINNKIKVQLSVPENDFPTLRLLLKSECVDINLERIPEEWLNYSL